MRDPTPADASITIVLADDHSVLRSGLRMLLDAEDDFHVLAEAGSIEAVFRAVRGHRPGVLVLDLNMPGGSSLAAIPRLTMLAPGMSVVVLTMDDDPVSERVAFEAGARGYVLKEAAGAELVSAIRAAAARG